MSTLSLLTLTFAVLMVVAAVATIRSFRARHHVRGLLGLVVTATALAATLLGGALSIATRGLEPFTREEVAALVEVRPRAEKSRTFEAKVRLPNQPERTFEVRGDQLQVGAQIVKWHPWVNVLGLHTAYELDRLTGRYQNARMAEDAEQTVHPLGQQRYIELPKLLERLPVLEGLVDAEYGSATFVEVDRAKTLEVRVSTSGLLVREADDNATLD
jgi:hypothetical protein